MTDKTITASHAKTLVLGVEKRLELSRRDRGFTHRKTALLTEMVNDILKPKDLKPKRVPAQREIAKETERLTDQVKEILDRNKNIW